MSLFSTIVIEQRHYFYYAHSSIAVYTTVGFICMKVVKLYSPENNKPELVELRGGESVDKRIYDPLTEMLEAAKEENLGELPDVVSGYRTRDKQQRLCDEKI